jgi:chromosome partitioning protein
MHKYIFMKYVNAEKHMKVVSIWNPKGGSGKSTTSLNLAGAASDIGLKVMVICDDPQGSSTWAASLGNLPFAVVPEVPSERPDVDLVIMDHAAGYSNAPPASIVVTPVRPCRMDYVAFTDAIRSLDDKKVVKVVSSADMRRRDEKEVSLALQKQGAYVVRSRSVYVRANNEGTTVFDPRWDKVGGTKEAISEFQAILAGVLGL